jgi:hypothetical protein
MYFKQLFYNNADVGDVRLDASVVSIIAIDLYTHRQRGRVNPVVLRAHDEGYRLNNTTQTLVRGMKSFNTNFVMT